jgi:two-component system response regulator FixJ
LKIPAGKSWWLTTTRQYARRWRSCSHPAGSGSFGEGTSLLNAARSRVPACIILDVQLPDKSGLEVLRELEAWDYPAPIIMISSRCDVAMAVDAITNGALDLIEKPFQPDAMLARIRAAVGAWTRRRGSNGANGLPAAFPGRNLLTPRELEVLTQVAGGSSNKDAARDLGISTRTVEVHRAHIMDKLGAKNAADLVRLVLQDRRSH